MIDDELKAIRMRCDAATPGPWEVGEGAKEQAATLRAQPILATTGRPQGKPVDVILPFGRAYSDARFCAAARTDVPQLLGEVERLRGLINHDTAWRSTWEGQLGNERDALRAEVDRFRAWIEWARACLLDGGRGEGIAEVLAALDRALDGAAVEKAVR